MRAVLAACCLFAVCLLFARGDEKCTETTDDGDAPPPPSGSCVDTENPDNCKAWIRYCDRNTYTQTHCQKTCQLC
uniref:ShKL5 n=1 Tax=Colubraria reticulata TaxID=604273 RepID=A0A481SMH5_9CAEN|nr:ShKL5 [Colubraria reticulata]